MAYRNDECAAKGQAEIDTASETCQGLQDPRDDGSPALEQTLSSRKLFVFFIRSSHDL
jgi:hypothetical protein